jgi:hypothetical protein
MNKKRIAKRSRLYFACTIALISIVLGIVFANKVLVLSWVLKKVAPAEITQFTIQEVSFRKIQFANLVYSNDKVALLVKNLKVEFDLKELMDKTVDKIWIENLNVLYKKDSVEANKELKNQTLFELYQSLGNEFLRSLPFNQIEILDGSFNHEKLGLRTTFKGSLETRNLELNTQFQFINSKVDFTIHQREKNFFLESSGNWDPEDLMNLYSLSQQELSLPFSIQSKEKIYSKINLKLNPLDLKIEFQAQFNGEQLSSFYEQKEWKLQKPQFHLSGDTLLEPKTEKHLGKIEVHLKIDELEYSDHSQTFQSGKIEGFMQTDLQEPQKIKMNWEGILRSYKKTDFHYNSPIELKVQLAEQILSTQWSKKAIPVGKINLLLKIGPDYNFEFYEVVNGRIHLEALKIPNLEDWEITSGQLTTQNFSLKEFSKNKVNLQNLSLSNSELDLHLDLGSCFFTVKTPQENPILQIQNIKIPNFHRASLKFQDLIGSIDYQLKPPQLNRIDLTVNTLEGSIEIKDTHYSVLNQSGEFRLWLESINLTELQKQIPDFQGSITGHLSGTLPFAIKDNEWIPLQGSLRLLPPKDPKHPNRLSFLAKGLLTKGMAENTRQFKEMSAAEKALENLTLEDLIIDISPTPKSPFKVKILGESTLEEQDIFMGFKGDKKINLDLNLNLNGSMKSLLDLGKNKKLNFSTN